MLLIMIKLIGIFLCIYGSTDISYPPEYKEFLDKSILYRFQYLTIIGLYMTLLTVSLLLIDQLVFIITKRCNEKLKKLTSFLIVVVLPIEIIISVVFWSLYLYDPRTIINEIILATGGITLFQNICMHAIPLFLLTLEIYYIDVKRDNFHVMLLCVFGMLYYLFLRFVAKKANRWPYPFLDGKNEITRAFIFFAMTISGVFIYEICMLCIKLKNERSKKKKE